MTKGILYVTYGEAARREASASIATLERHYDYPVFVSDENLVSNENGNLIPLSRAAKLNLDKVSPFQYNLYLDADTRIVGDLAPGFKMLADGWSMVIAPSGRQGSDVMGHLPADERGFTLEAVGNPLPLQWGAGVFYFDRDQVGPLFAAWRKEWARFGGQDQGALLRALAAVPIRMWVLGAVWNQKNGEVIDHLFGRARV